MFTGLVEEMGTVRSRTDASLEIICETVVADARVGDSISVNGCCLTVTDLTRDGFVADLMGETLERTGLGTLRTGDRVNLERPLLAGGRLGGHLVQGHVDGVATVLAVDPEGGWTRMTCSLPQGVARYVVEKGSVTVDGVSLTVTAVAEGSFSVGLIPHTLAVTTLGRRTVGDHVNLEADVIAKYTERLLTGGVVTPYTQER